MTGVMGSEPSSATYQPRGERRKQPLKTCVQSALELYFMDLDGHEPEAIYNMVLSEVEHAMFESVMQHVGGNQTRAAQALGLNRSTLRKKLKLYQLLK